MRIRGVNLAAFVLAKGEDNRVSVVFDVIWRSLVHIAAVNCDGAPLELSYGVPVEIVKISVVIPFCCRQKFAYVAVDQHDEWYVPWSRYSQQGRSLNGRQSKVVEVFVVRPIISQ